MRENPDAAEQMDTEQTWPTEEEMATAAPPRRRLPPGMSDYQACWILDDDVPDDADSDDGAAAPAAGVGTAAADVAGGEGAMEFGSDGGSDMDLEEEPLDLAELRRIRQERQKQAVADDVQFPDEMDTPHEMPARVRPCNPPPVPLLADRSAGGCWCDLPRDGLCR